jgi:hypothetical protein
MGASAKHRGGQQQQQATTGTAPAVGGAALGIATCIALHGSGLDRSVTGSLSRDESSAHPNSIQALSSRLLDFEIDFGSQGADVEEILYSSIVEYIQCRLYLSILSI